MSSPVQAFFNANFPQHQVDEYALRVQAFFTLELEMLARRLRLDGARPTSVLASRIGAHLVSAPFLHAVMPELKLAHAETFVPFLNEYLTTYEIDTIPRLTAFIGNVAVESGEMNKTEESTYYSHASRLRAVYPHAFTSTEMAERFTRNPEATANLVYANRNGNGDVASGDGWRFRGRGLIQLTGRSEYAVFARDTGVDVIRNPELLAQPRYAVWSACWFWGRYKNINHFADIQHFEHCGYMVNGKLPPLGWSDREKFRRIAKWLILNKFEDSFKFSS